MEHQSGVAYGNKFQNGYLGRDLSGTGWGLKWDFIIIHESGHEWFGNNITTKDIADMWVHEGFTNYSEVLYTENTIGRAAANEYCYGIRKNIKNDDTIIGYYGVNKEGSGDMYPKAANMMNMIRITMNDDTKFRNILRGLSKSFYHKTVTTQQVEQFITDSSGIDFSKLFEQYLRTTQIPSFDYYYFKKKKKLYYKWSNCISGFNLPLSIKIDEAVAGINPTEKWNSISIDKKNIVSELIKDLEKQYYVQIREIKTKPKFN